MQTPATILICDDEPSLRELMRICLGPRYSYAEAGGTAEAIDLVEQLEPDLLLLDVMMPGGSGLSVVEHVRRNPRLASTPVVVISAFTAEADRRAALEAGATDFLEKPFDPEHLEALVEELLAEAQ